MRPLGVIFILIGGFFVLVAGINSLVPQTSEGAATSFLQFLFGGVGVVLGLILVVAARPKQLSESDLLRSGDSKKCPQCAEIVKAEAKICKHCGNSF